MLLTHVMLCLLTQFIDCFLVCFSQHTDYDKVAEGYGGVGYQIKNGTNEDIDEIFEKAKEMQKKDKPVLINALIGKTDFREGSISI